jgi:hypothetical protein
MKLKTDYLFKLFKMEYEKIQSNESSHDKRFDKSEIAITASWAVNWTLFILKSYLTFSSHSKAVLAALVDSVGITIYLACFYANII